MNGDRRDGVGDEAPARDDTSADAPSTAASTTGNAGLGALLRALAETPRPDLPGAFEHAFKPGQRVGRFELVREIGTGSFGVVFEAVDTQLHRAVAFKAVRPGRRTTAIDEMLVQEAEAAARLQHENIVGIHDFGRCDTGPYLILELLRGETLAARLARGPLTVPEAIHVALGVARGLAHAHAAGLLHRDVKPSNVFLTDAGGVKLLDLGLAHLFGTAGASGGTPAYMSPEQWRDEALDARSDLFSLGAVLFEMLARRRPYAVLGDRSTVLDPGAEPGLGVRGLPRAIERLVQRSIAKDRAGRPASARAFGEGLLAIQRRLDPAVVRGRRLATGLAGALLLALAGVGLVALRGAGPGAPRASVAVADFEDRTGEEGLAGLSSLLITSLEQSQRVGVLPRSRLKDLLRRAGREDVERIDEARGREAGKLAGAKVLLLSTLHRFGEVYALEVRGVDPGSDRSLFALKEQARRRDELPDMLDRVSEGVRRALAEEGSDIEARSVRLAQVVTSDLEAWNHYYAGTECTERNVFTGTFGDCVAELRKAVAKDPGFALAHFRISLVLDWQGAPRPEQKAALEPALRNQHRIPPHSLPGVRGWAAYLDGDDVKAKALLAQAAEAAPDDKFGWFLAGEVPFHRDEFQEAVPFLLRAQELDPAWFAPVSHLALALGWSGGAVSLKPIVARLQALGPRPAPLAGLCYAYLWVLPDRATDACRRAVQAGAGTLGTELLAIALINGPDLGELERHLDRMAADDAEDAEGAARDRPLSFGWYVRLILRGQQGRWRESNAVAAEGGNPDDWTLHGVRAELAVGQGDREGAWREARRAMELDRRNASNLAVHLAYLGDLEHAGELAVNLPVASPRVEVYRAVVRWKREGPAAAVEALGALAVRNPMSIEPAIPFPQFLLGEALAEAGRDAEAVAALRRFLAQPLNYPSWQKPRALFFLARSQERTGDREGARETLGRLLDLWRGAEPSQPYLAEARALARKVGGP